MILRFLHQAWDNWRSLATREAVHYPALDGLRAVAVLQVLFFHVYFLGARHLGEERFRALIEDMSPWWNWVWQGDKGVDLFFVLSGFLISAALLREQRAHGRVRLARYLVRRGARILPAYYSLLMIAVVLQIPGRSQVWVNLLFLNNLVDDGNAFIPWSWSIAVEVQFYLLFPFLLLPILYRVRRPVGVVCLVLALFALLRIAVITAYPEYYQRSFSEVLYDETLLAGWMNDVYIHLYSRATPILTGILAGVLHVYQGERLRRFADRHAFRMTLITLAALFLLILSAGTPLSDPASDYYLHFGAIGNLWLLGLHRTLFALAAGWILLSSLHPSGLAGPLSRLLGMRVWVPIAKVSYSLYLIHIFVIGWVLSWTRSWLGVSGHDHWLMIALLVLNTLIGLALASLSYALIEKPGIDIGKRLIERMRR